MKTGNREVVSAVRRGRAVPVIKKDLMMATVDQDAISINGIMEESVKQKLASQQRGCYLVENAVLVQNTLSQECKGLKHIQS